LLFFSNLLLSINAADIVEILKLLTAGNLVKCTYMQKTKMMHVHRNNFLKGLRNPNFTVQYEIISLSYFIKLCDNIKTDLCPGKNYLNKSVTYKIQIYYQLYFFKNQHFKRCSHSDLEHTKQTEYTRLYINLK
jgi:hypothetical protein